MKHKRTAEDLFNRARNDTALLGVCEALHCVRLTGACLSVCDNGRIVALHNSTRSKE